MVVILSSDSNISPQVMREAERAVNKGISIIPLRIEDVPLSKELEYFLSAAHWLDALTPPLQGHLDILADRVKSLLSGENVAPAVQLAPMPAPRQLPVPDVPADIAATIQQHAAKEYPDDYSMQSSNIESQVKAFQDLARFTSPNTPADVLEQLLRGVARNNSDTLK